jgi:choline dehydrogenase-like flavoprotein
MITDARRLPGGTVVPCELCVVGGGAAGISIALEFIHGPGRVVLLEGGGLDFSAASQALYEGESVGLPYEDLATCRVRHLGGSTNREGWGGWCKPLDEVEFHERPWVPNSGWPLSAGELRPYYERAQSLCQLGPYDYDLSSWQEQVGAGAIEVLPLAGRVCTEIQQMSPPTRFGETYRESLRRSAHVDVHLHANAVEILTTADAARATGIRVRTLEGIEYRVEARTVVLCAGGIENARLLLASRAVESTGLGNRHDLVGRYFMDHIRVDIGRLVLSAPGVDTGFYDPAHTFLRRSRAHNGTYDPRLLAGSLTLSRETQRTEGLLNYRAWLVGHYTDYESPGVKALRYLYLAIRDRQLPPRLLGLVADMVKDVRNVSGALFDRFVRAKRRGPSLLVNIIEPEPNPDSRVTILDERDVLGVPRVQVSWQLRPNVARTLARAHEIIDEELGRAGLGRLEGRYVDEGGIPQPLRWVWHHMGTTRMHDDPERGVVDRDCRLHGLPNLFVAGSSVFPSAGNDMPTLTIVALALRLADHLKKEVALR